MAENGENTERQEQPINVTGCLLHIWQGIVHLISLIIQRPGTAGFTLIILVSIVFIGGTEEQVRNFFATLPKLVEALAGSVISFIIDGACVVIAIATVFTYRYIRKRDKEELERVIEERNTLQQVLIGKAISHSNGDE